MITGMTCRVLPKTIQEIELQWGPAMITGMTRVDVTGGVEVTLAAMGPGDHHRDDWDGRTYGLDGSTVLQWGPAMITGMTLLTQPQAAAAYALQWGPAMITGMTSQLIEVHAARLEAAMGPGDDHRDDLEGRTASGRLAILLQWGPAMITGMTARRCLAVSQGTMPLRASALGSSRSLVITLLSFQLPSPR